ncbi:tandem-95 repeat protein, partial [Mycobacterium sp. NPDC003323]
NAVNDAPTGTPTTIDADEDSTTIGGTLTGTDIEATDPGQLSYVLETDADHGVVDVDEDGTWTYTPAANYSGTDSFTYTIVDADGASSAPVTVTINMRPLNDAPVGSTGLAATGAEDASGGMGGILTATDADGDSLTYALGAQAGNGTVTVNADGTWTYTPNANFHGTDTFTYTVSDGTATAAPVSVTITVTPVNDAPTATAGLSGSGNEDTAITGTLTGTDIDGDTLTYALSSQAGRGTVIVNADGDWTYTPNTNYTGTDSFTYTVSDGHGGVSTPVTVNVTVAAVNDAPVARADSFSTAEDTTLSSGNLLGNDTDVDGDTITVVGNTQPAHGSVTVGSDGSFTYTPAANYSGTDSFSYTIADADGSTSTASVTIAVTAVNDQPVGAADSFTTTEDTSYSGNVLGNDTDPDGNTLTATVVVGPQHGSLQWNSDGTFTYTPDPNYNGTDTFTYQASDGPASTAAILVTMTVTAVNDSPTAAGAVTGGSGNEDTAISGRVGFGDVDTGDTTTLTVTTPAEHGTVVLNADGTYTYTPTANYHGADSFTYTVTDGLGATATAAVSITVAAANDAPVANAEDFGTINQSTVTPGQVIGNVLDNDTDVDAGDTRSVTSWTQVPSAAGSINVASNGVVTFTPNTFRNYDGVVTFSYTITDSQGATSTSTASFTLNDDIAPTAVDVQSVNSGTAGLLNQGDAITYTFSEPIDPNSIIAGWDGAGSRNVTVRVYDGSLGLLNLLGFGDVLRVYDSTDTTQLALGSVSLGGVNYVSGAVSLLTGPNIWFSGSTMTLSSDRTKVTITLGEYNYSTTLGVPLGAVRGTNIGDTTMTWVPDTAVRDAAGNTATSTNATETSTADRDF